MKFRFLEISPRNGSHYLISDQGELARYNDAETGLVVRQEMIEWGAA
jgi:hypothetical protein